MNSSFLPRRHILRFGSFSALLLTLSGCGNGASNHSANALLTAGSNFLNSGNCTKAINSFSKYLLDNPDNTIALQGLAQCYANEGLWNKTIDLLTKVVKLDPNFEPYQALAQAYKAQGEYSNAYNALIAASSAPNISTQMLVNLASTASSWEGYDASLEILNKIPNDAWTSTAFLVAAMDVSTTGAVPETQTYINKAVKMATSYELGNTLQQAGNIWFNMLNFTEAANSYNEAIRAGHLSDPESLYTNLGSADSNIGSFVAAEAAYSQAMNFAASASQREEDQYQIGEVLLRSGDVVSAEKIFKALTGPNVSASVKQQASSTLSSIGATK